MKHTTSLLLIAICVLIMFGSHLGGQRPAATTSPVTNTRRDLVRTMLSLVCAGLFALSLSGCAEEADIYSREYRDTPEYRYNTYYGPDYYPYFPYDSYYGGGYY
jgi:hypothetical protein